MIPWCPATLLSATLIISDIQIQKYSRFSAPPPLFAIAISLGGENCGHGPKYEIIRSIRTFRFFFPNIRLYVLFLISERGKSQIAKNFSEI
jgi:hypothetical protein